MIKTLEELSLTKGEYGGGFSAVDYSEDKPRYIRITDIKEGGELKKDTKSPSGTEKDWKKYKLVEGDILFARSGATVGKTFLYEEKYGDCIYAGYLIRFKPNTKIAYPKYVYYYTRTPKYNAWVLNKQNVVAQPNINAKQYGTELKIPLPPLPTQKKIAALLDAADAYRQKTKALIEKYDELTQSLFLDMFGDPVVNEKGWEKVQLSKLCSFDKMSVKPDDIKEGETYLGLECIEKMTGNILNKFTVHAGELKSNKFWFNKDYILYGKLRPYLNKVAVPTFEGVCSTDIIPIKPIKNITTKEFITSLMRGDWFVSFADERSSGANLPRISPREVEKYRSINPPFPLQNQFAEHVQKIEAQKAQAQESLEKAEELFNSLLGRAFKGEVSI